MVEVKTEYPFIKENGEKDFESIKHYAEDENGNHYYLLQVETGKDVYSEAIDDYPCRYTYKATNKKVKENIE